MILRIHASLRKRGYLVWIDTEMMCVHTRTLHDWHELRLQHLCCLP